MTLGIIFGLFAALFQGFSYIFMRRSLAEFPASMSFFMNAVTGILIWIPFALFTNGVWADVPTVFPYALLSAILSEALVFYALAKGDTIITGVLFATYPLFTILFAFLFLQEQLLAFAWLALALVIIGTIIVSAPSKKEWLDNKLLHWKFHLIVYPLVAATAVGVSDVIGKHTVDQTSAGTFLIALALAEIPVSIVFLKLQKQRASQLKTFFTHYKDYKYAFLSGVLGTLTLIALWLAFEALPASVASPLTALSPIFVFVLGIFFLKERISVKNTAGLIIVTMGVLLLSLYGF
jgi:transporter family protein